MLKLLLWLRYLKQRKIVLLSITAVAVSVALLIVVASLFKGFIRAYEQSAVDLIGDVLLNTPMDIDNHDVLIDELEQSPEIEAATATSSAVASCIWEGEAGWYGRWKFGVLNRKACHA